MVEEAARCERISWKVQAFVDVSEGAVLSRRDGVVFRKASEDRYRQIGQNRVS